MTTILSQAQLEHILADHVDRVIDGFDNETLAQYAKDMMREEFRSRGKVDEDYLINELFEYECGEQKEVENYLRKHGVDDDTIADIMAL